jgi:hypothetical protein
VSALLCVVVNVGFLLCGFSVAWCGTEGFVTYGSSVLTRIAYYFISMTGQRFMYYIPWLLNDAASIACGLAYNGSLKGEKEV